MHGWVNAWAGGRGQRSAAECGVVVGSSAHLQQVELPGKEVGVGACTHTHQHQASLQARARAQRGGAHLHVLARVCACVSGGVCVSLGRGAGSPPPPRSLAHTRAAHPAVLPLQ